MRFLFLIFLIVGVHSLFAAVPGLQLVERTENSDIYRLTFDNIRMETVAEINGRSYARIMFDQAGFPAVKDGYDLPARSLLFGIPQNGALDVRIISSKEVTLSDFLPYRVDGEYEKTGNASISRLETGTPSVFRDMAIQPVTFLPVSYNPQSNSARVWSEVTFEVRYNGINDALQSTFRKRTAMDDLYPDVIANFERAQNWQLPRTRTLKKAAAIAPTTHYKFEVSEDGIYRLNASTLRNAGANLDNVPLSAVQVFNNGGHALSFATNATLYNPASTQEIPVKITDSNSNGLFDGNDYILLFGKGVNSYFYEPGQDQFSYQMHPYDTKNSYLVTVNGSGGKRVQLESPQVSNPQPSSTAYDFFRFEKDEYNLLASGPDWYGHRFFGQSGSFSQNFGLPALPASAEPVEFRIQFKGGSGIRYGDNAVYSYRFNVDLNGTNLLNSVSMRDETRQFFTRTIDNPSLLSENGNTISIQYSSTNEGSVAYLDWFELSFAKSLAARNDMLSFFTKRESQNVQYNVSGFSGAYHIWDVTDPANPVAYKENAPASESSIALAASDGPRHIYAFREGASAVKTVSSVRRVTPQTNLLDNTQQADFIIITSGALQNYAGQIADLRDNLTSKIVPVSDIYFYFNSGVKDPVALRNFIRYAYFNWSDPAPQYVLLFGDGHYDYRNIEISDSSVVPTFQIYDDHELGSRSCDNFFAQVSVNTNSTHLIVPSLALGRLPVENALDAERVLEKLKTYDENPIRDGWQTFITVVGDDERVSNENRIEWIHQQQAENLASLSELAKFNISRIYLSRYEESAGGFGRLKPQATRDLLNQINRGSLIVNYVGHGSPTTWAHETVFNFDRDYSKINNEGRYPFFIAATCDFAKFDDPNDISFTEALIWKERSGMIGTVASTRLVYSGQNFEFNRTFYRNLFPSGGPSVTLGKAMLRSLSSNSFNNINDQKYYLLADPTMHLADAREEMQITEVSPDTLKALSRVEVKAAVVDDAGSKNASFSGGAVMLVHDAKYQNVNTGGGTGLDYDLIGPLVFKGEVSVDGGQMQGNFIVPKSIRYQNEKTGRITVYAWDDATNRTAISYVDDLLFLGSAEIDPETSGPDIDIFFEGQENFSSGDLIRANPVLLAALRDESGINITGQLGHQIELIVDENDRINISEFFTYERDSYTSGTIRYPLSGLASGKHTLRLQAFDNLNNSNESVIEFNISESNDLLMTDVVNYPNPFSRETEFTFQCNSEGAEVSVKIYTISGRLIEKLEGFVSRVGFNRIPWSGLDRDGNTLANGVYLYKVTINDGNQKEEKIEKMVLVR